MTKRFTGWHMFGILAGMFGVIIAVNVVMARQAIATFGGTVVENSYVASQRYNHWLAQARTQKALGWTAEASVDAARHVEIATSAPEGTRAVAVVQHPLGRAAERSLTFTRTGDRFVSSETLPAGRWLLRIELRDAANGNVARFEDEVP